MADAMLEIKRNACARKGLKYFKRELKFIILEAKEAWFHSTLYTSTQQNTTQRHDYL